MDTLDRTWQGTEPLLGPTIHQLKPITAIRTKGSFSPTSGFTLVNLWWSHAVIEIPYPALFPLPIPRPNPIKTRNPAPTSNWNSRFPPHFLAQIPNITMKKCQIPHPAKPIGDPQFRSGSGKWLGKLLFPSVEWGRWIVDCSSKYTQTVPYLISFEFCQFSFSSAIKKVLIL